MSSLAAVQLAPLPEMPTWPVFQDKVTVLEPRVTGKWHLITAPVGKIWNCKCRYTPRSLCTVEIALVIVTWSAVQTVDSSRVNAATKFKSSWYRLKHASMIRTQYVKMPICCGIPSRRFWEECAVAEDAHTSGTSQRRMSQCDLCLRVIGWGFKWDDVS